MTYKTARTGRVKDRLSYFAVEGKQTDASSFTRWLRRRRWAMVRLWWRRHVRERLYASGAWIGGSPRPLKDVTEGEPITGTPPIEEAEKEKWQQYFDQGLKPDG